MQSRCIKAGRTSCGNSWGDTLEHLATARALGLREGVAFLAAIGGAVHRVHQRGFAHRNLHPSNVLIGPGDAPILIGFGLVGLLEGSALLPPGRTGVSAEVDVLALHGVLSWLYSTLGKTVPASVESMRRAGSLSSPAAFAYALEKWTHDHP
jgi:serine/threonine protein kinase